MRLLKRTREHDRIAADLEVHRAIMDEHVAAGKSRKKASRLALIDLQNIPTQSRINRANELRRTN